MSRRYTAKLLKAQEQGAEIVCSAAPYEGHKMEYAPRHQGDPAPWVLTGTEVQSFRYTGRECHAMKDGEVYIAVKLVRPLTDDQRHVLKALHDNNQGIWYPSCGWYWANRSTTVQHMEALVKKGYVEAVSQEKYKERYEITDAGRKEYRKQFPSLADDLNEKTDKMVEWFRENESSAMLVHGVTMWAWHDFLISMNGPREDGSVHFGVSVKGLPLPPAEKAESRDEAIKRAARTVVVWTMKRAGLSA
jgi:primosomal protein N'